MPAMDASRWPGLAALVAALVAAGCAAGPTGRPARPPSPSASCHLGPAGRPDRACTPGATNPAVTQATIQQTICAPGWTATVRPPLSYTAPLKVAQIRAYGYADRRPASYEEDHLLPLELGGAPRDPRNLWPELRGSGSRGSTTKDAAENAGRAAVCASTVTLAQAQAKILADWGPTP